MIQTSGPTAIYTRISEDRDDDRLGVQRQEQDCRALAKRLGWSVQETYEDNDLSASKAKVVRPAYQRLLKDIEAGKVTRVITDKPDRLYRRNTELEHLIDVVGDHVEIRTVKSGNIDLTTTNGRMVARILGATAQAEAETIRDRVRRKHQELATNGSWKGGPRPFGWAVQNGEFIEIPKEIGLLVEAKNRVLAGDLIHSICKDWRARGVRSGRGAIIAESTLLKMLISPRMRGMYPSGVEGQGKGRWRAIFTKVEWEQLKLVLKTRVRGKRRAGGVYMLTGEILKCGICGGTMYGSPTFAGRRVAYYQCRSNIQGQGCGRVAMRASLLDEQVKQHVAEHLIGSLWADPKLQWKHKAPKIGAAPDLAAASAEMSRVQQEFDDLAKLAGDGQITAAEWMIAKRGLEPRLKVATATLQASHAHALRLHELAGLNRNTFAGRWEAMEVEERRKVVMALVSQVRVQPHNVNIARTQPDPDRVEVDFRDV
jgi:DNA invertase Pin-like site-specific DNA recombinase